MTDDIFIKTGQFLGEPVILKELEESTLVEGLLFIVHTYMCD